MNWRWNYNTGGGQLLDWMGYHGTSRTGAWFDNTGPSEIEGQGSSSSQRTLEHLYEISLHSEVSNDVR